MKTTFIASFALLFTFSAFGQSRADQDLMRAIKKGSFENAVKAIEKGADVNGADSAQAPTTNMLIKAVKLNRLEIAKLLLEKGADPNVLRPIDQQSALMIAAKQDNAEMIELLLQFGCEENLTTILGRNALNISALWNSLNAAKVLLEKSNIDVNARKDLCPLAVAARQGHKEMVKLLLAQKGEKLPNQECVESAINMAQHNQHQDIAALLKKD